jgi:hypothetical protein
MKKIISLLPFIVILLIAGACFVYEMFFRKVTPKQPLIKAPAKTGGGTTIAEINAMVQANKPKNSAAVDNNPANSGNQADAEVINAAIDDEEALEDEDEAGEDEEI